MHIAGSGTPYWYEWEVGMVECLKMMNDTSIESVILQSVDFQSLDDVIINYCDGSIVNIQVKHSDIGENFTYSTLTDGEKPMLEKWAKEWQQEKNNYSIKEIRVITNRQWGSGASGKKCSFKKFVTEVYPKLQLDYEYKSTIPNETAACEWFKKQISYLGDDAFDFIKTLNFYQEDNLEDIELKIRKLVAEILGTEKKEAVNASTDSLLAKLSTWSTSRRKKREITREDIYNTLCTASANLPNYEIYPEKPIFPSREAFAKLFIERLQSSEKKIFFLQGLPGAGKTNFISYLAQLENSIVDFRFYTYLPVNKEYPSFSDDEGYYTGDLLWRSLLTQLKAYFEKQNMLYELNFPLKYNYLSVTEMREMVLKYLPLYAKTVGHTCYVFIDGLDHAARSRNARNSFLSQLPLPNEIDGDVRIVLVGQPINDKYPHQLIKNDQIEYIDLPTLEEPDIIMLLSNEGIIIPNIDTSSLAKSIISIVGNNALNILFAVYEVKRMPAEYSFDAITECLCERKLNCQIDRYYDWIVSSITDCDALLLKIKMIFAFASQKISAQHIANMCGVNLEDTVISLNKLYPLILCDSDGYFTFHNDVRLFFKETMVSNSNYDTLALSIYNKIIDNDALGKYNYDISFGLILELENKEFLFELFSPEYIIKSIQYKIPVNKLVQQFHTITQLVAESGSLDNIDKISFAASTISQYVNNIQFNQKEDLFYSDRMQSNKTESEKYILSVHEKINVIVNDVYYLLKKGLHDRATKIFDEYLGEITLNEYLCGNQDNSDRDYCEHCGYICRFFATSILEQESDIESADYVAFIKGWLDASSEFVKVEDIKTTFSFKNYCFEFLNDYTLNICKKELVPEAFDCLCEIYMSGSNKPISSLVDLCVNGVLFKRNIDELQKTIFERQSDILTSKEFKYDTDRIRYYIKAYFCMFILTENSNEIPKLYLDILQKNHITPDHRGYIPAISQFDLAQKIFKEFFEGNIDYDNQVEIIYSTAYFTQRHGSGSCSDCNAYEVRKFLLKVLFSIHSNNENKIELLKICDSIKGLFVWENAMYINELSQLFYIAGAENDYLEIANHWCGDEGILWDYSYTDVEYIGMDVVYILNQFGKVSEAQVIEKCILFKLFGYVDHKDYSLNGIIECYKYVPLSEEKLLNHGMQLLTISDKASSIGDNRLAGEINNILFETASSLGVMYISALFELKNTPEEFYGWRNCFLDVYFKNMSREELPDSELVALHSIVNAWINCDIESSIEHGYNQTEHLQHYNYKIIEQIKDEDIRNELLSFGNNLPISENNTNDYVIQTVDADDSIINEIRQKGYCIETEQKINAMFSDIYGRHETLLIDIGEIIDVSQNHEFISNCVVEYITKKRKYGYRMAGLIQLIEVYHKYFSSTDWIKLFDNIVSSISTSNMEDFYCINEDIEILCLYYFKATNVNKLSGLCLDMLKTHCEWLTSCGLIKLKTYDLQIDTSIDSLASFANYQLGYNK